MRIVHGELGGRQPVLPKNLDARPTTDMARGALFNILLNRFDFDEIRVLDLFSGTGLISFEFASLGCLDITAIERDKYHCEAIRKNIQLFNIKHLRLIQGDVFAYIQRLNMEFDIVFADPPYELQGIDELPGRIKNLGLVKPGGCLILEHGPRNEFKNEPGWLETREYSKVHFSFFTY